MRRRPRARATRRALELLEHGADSVAATAAEELSARDVGRDAPARDDRDGAGVLAAVLLADEPTTALDVTVQIQILLLLRQLQRELGMAMVFVTHDVGVAAEISDRIAVMYAGRFVESGTARRDHARAASIPTRGAAGLHRAWRVARARPGDDPRQAARSGARCRLAAPSRRALPLRAERLHRGDAPVAFAPAHGPLRPSRIPRWRRGIGARRRRSSLPVSTSSQARCPVRHERRCPNAPGHRSRIRRPGGPDRTAAQRRSKRLGCSRPTWIAAGHDRALNAPMPRGRWRNPR